MSVGKTMATNRRARFDFEILETVEAGLVLTGTEIKAINDLLVSSDKARRAKLTDCAVIIGLRIGDFDDALHEAPD